MMMDTSEAIKSLDGYSEILVSSSILIKSGILAEDAGEEKYAYSQRLIDQLKQNLADGRWFVQEILKEIHEVGISSSDPVGLGAAIQRYVTADGQASEALGKTNNAKTPSASAVAIQKFLDERYSKPK